MVVNYGTGEQGQSKKTAGHVDMPAKTLPFKLEQYALEICRVSVKNCL